MMWCCMNKFRQLRQAGTCVMDEGIGEAHGQPMQIGIRLGHRGSVEARGMGDGA